ncbi:MAG: GNAT family N-acetyltransferase [Promethearchaeota archaeon]
MFRLNFRLIDFKIIPAEKDHEDHRKGIWTIRNENINYSKTTTQPISYTKHCEWWEYAFDKEYIYLILYKEDIVGYIRLTKNKTSSKEKNEISIALSKNLQGEGIGSYVYMLFEEQIKNLGINKIIAITDIKNTAGRKFFEKNKFKKTHIRFVKDL